MCTSKSELNFAKILPWAPETLKAKSNIVKFWLHNEISATAIDPTACEKWNLASEDSWVEVSTKIFALQGNPMEKKKLVCKIYP